MAVPFPNYNQPNPLNGNPAFPAGTWHGTAGAQPSGTPFHPQRGMPTIGTNIQLNPQAGGAGGWSWGSLTPDQVSNLTPAMKSQYDAYVNGPLNPANRNLDLLRQQGMEGHQQGIGPGSYTPTPTQTTNPLSTIPSNTTTQSPTTPTTPSGTQNYTNPNQQTFGIDDFMSFLPSYLQQPMNNPFQSSSYDQYGANQQQNTYGLPSQGWGWGP